MEEIRQNLETICKIFKLGNLLCWKEESKTNTGFRTVIFNSEKEQNLLYHFKKTTP